ncbi:zinc-ribbon and DUF3426 domain-containing protein [Limnohabitans sp.]|jgi:predicted Zn finger-like uncharacterized protein
MNWITRCPECSTVYQVSPDLTLVAKGWLRCGQCQIAFDSAGLILACAGTASALITRELDTTERLDIEDLLKQEDRASVSSSSLASVDLASFEETLSSFKPEIEKTIAELASAPSMAVASASMAGSVDSDSQDTPGSKRESPSVLWVWALLLSLLAQCIWIERHPLMARWPALGEPFMAVCRAIGCASEFSRDVNVMVIDSSSFIQRDEGHELAWTIRNSGEHVVEMTALEMTLHDVQGKPVLRRVLLPADMGAPPALMPGQIWAGQLFIRVDSEILVTGYRVLSFYP